MKLRIGRAIVVALTALSASVASGADLPSFASAVEVVNLEVSVTDARNHFVASLTDQDFEVYEDGVKQQVAVFAKERLPLTVAILIDRSGSMVHKLPVAQAAACRLIRALAPEDRASVAQFNERLAPLLELSSDHEALEAAVRSSSVSGATGFYNALYVTLRELRSERRADEQRRWAIVVLTDGVDTSSLIDDEQVLAEARQAGITVYVIALPYDGLDHGSREGGLATYFVKRVSDETGGEAYFPRALADLDGVYDRIAEELRTQYSLGYAPSNPRQDGGWRRVAIGVARGAFQVRHRQGYFAPKPATPAR